MIKGKIYKRECIIDNMNVILKSMLVIFMLLFIFNFVSAVENIGYAKQNTCISLPQSDLNSTFQNITYIQHPDKTFDILNINMTKDGSFYYYNYCNTTQIGEYIVNGFSNIDSWAYTFQVTKQGNILTQSESTISSSAVYFLLGLGIVLIVFGFFMFNRGFWSAWVGIFSVIIGFIILYYDLSLVNYYVNTITLSGSSANGVFMMVTRFIKLLPYITWLIVGFAIVYLLKNIKKNNSDGWDNNNY